MAEAFIHIGTSNGYVFPNASNNDIVFFGSDETQSVIIGTKSNVNSGIDLSTSNLNFTIQGNTATNAIRFFTSNDTERLTILGDGKVGISDSTPAYTLDVGGDINFTGNLTQNGVQFVSGGGGEGWSNNTSNLFSMCNIGIGVNTPSEKLHVAGNVFLNSGGSLWITNNSDSNGRLRLHHDGNGNHAYVDYWSNLYFRASPGGGSVTYVSFTSNGYVGLGTSTNIPMSRLHVAGSIFSTSNFIATLGSSNAPTYTFSNDYDTGIYSPAANTIGFVTSNVERIRIDNTGNIGIGLSNPSSILQVKAPLPTLTGTVTVSNANSTVWGTGTSFLSTIYPGDTVTISGNPYVVQYVSNDTTMTFQTSVSSATSSGLAYTYTRNTTALDITSSGRLRTGNIVIGNTHGTSAGLVYNGFSANTQYCILQSSTGDTYVNSLTGKYIRFCENHNVVMTMFGSKFGILEQAPWQVLHVNGSIYSTSNYFGLMGTSNAPTYTFSNDTDTGIYSPAANTLGFVTSNVERLRIDAAGVVSVPGSISEGGTSLATKYSLSNTQSNYLLKSGDTITGNTLISSNIALSFTSTTTNTSRMVLWNDQTNSHFVFGNNLYFKSHVSGTPTAMTLTSNMNLVVSSNISEAGSFLSTKYAPSNTLSNFLPLSGGDMNSNAISFTNSHGSIGYGTGDGATSNLYNLRIGSWWGIGFHDKQGDATRIWFNVRTGEINASSFKGDGSNVTNLNMGNAGLGTLAVARGGTGTTYSTGTATSSNVLSDSPTMTGTLTVPTVKLGTIIPTTSNIDIGCDTATSNVSIGCAANVQSINIGSSGGATTINIGGTGDTVNISGTLTYVQTTDLQVTDKTIILNKGGAIDSGSNAGIHIEENSTATGYIKTNRNSWLFRTPAGSTDTTMDLSVANVTNFNSGTLALSNTSVGIGTTSPAYKLQVNGTAYATLVTTSSGSNATSGYTFTSNPGGGTGDLAWMRYYARTGEDCCLELGTTNDTQDNIYLNPSGNVGIATWTPWQKLHVVGSVYSTSNYVATLGSAAAPTYTFSNDTNTGIFSPGADTFAVTTGGVERLRADSNGKVGVGTTAPWQDLHVNGLIYTTSNYVGPLGTSNAPTYTFSNDTDTGIYSPAANTLGFVTSNVERISISETGYVGISKSVPAYTLDVSGDINFTGNLTKSGVQFTSGGAGWSNNNANVFTLCNIGIGLSTPSLPLDVQGNVAIGSNKQWVTYRTNNSNLLLPKGDGLINGVNITALNERTRASKATAIKAVSTWTTRTISVANSWYSVCWSSELSLFCSVANTGTSNRVMTSPDGITWTTRTSAADNNWNSVCWSPELKLYCAVASTGTGNRVMTSADGITWTTRTSASDNSWRSVCWSPELGLFCAVATSGTGNRVMTSANGITWTTRTSAADNNWNSVCWSPELGLFCAVASIGAGNRVMTSPDGITWTTRSTSDETFNSVCWSPELNLFCAVSSSGTAGFRVATSPNGITWTLRNTPNDSWWSSVCWSPELSLFCATAYNGSTYIMTSPDGITWTLLSGTGLISGNWYSVCWCPELSMFCSVSSWGNVSTSAVGMPNSQSAVLANPSHMKVLPSGYVGIGTTAPSYKLHVSETTNTSVALRLSASNSLLHSDIGITNVNDTFITGATKGDLCFKNYTGCNIRFGYGASGTHAMTIDKTGLVGIGLTNPTSALHVNGDFTVNSNIYMTGRPNFQGVVINKRTGGSVNISTAVNNIGGYTYNNSISLQPATACNVLIDTTGKLGVGTLSPAYKLDVAGDIYASGDITAFSDARYKSDLSIIENALDKVKQVTGYTYLLHDITTNEPSEKRHTGVLAQDLQKVLPEAVKQDPNGVYGVCYGNMTGMIVEAIKSLDNKVNKLYEHLGLALP